MQDNVPGAMGITKLKNINPDFKEFEIYWWK